MAEEDSRFSKFSTDPKFRSVPKKVRKVEIDGRFQSMFKDRRFLDSKVKVDKRGRPTTAFRASENFKKYYELSKEEKDSESDSDDSDDDDGNSEEFSDGSKPKSSDDENDQIIKDSDDEGSSEDEEEHKEEKVDTVQNATKRVESLKEKPKIKEKLKDLNVDYARGEGVLDSSSSSSEEEEESEVEDVDEDEAGSDVFDKWGELDHDSERTSEISSRLAVCNMDWDRVKAEDLFIALSSFCPSGGHLKNVSVYVSDFGKKRLAEEEQMGPEELRAKMNQDESDLSDVDDAVDAEAMEKKAMERVRKYQVNRLKYFYAVAVFDNAKTANAVYEQCDNTEFELSATRFDLRFIPDDMTFPTREEASSYCDTLPDPDKYKPKLFENSALQKRKVELTWDEVDPDRTRAMQRAFEVEDLDADMDDYRAYIASSGSDEEVEEEEVENEDDTDAIAKYKALLANITQRDNKKKEEEGNMEVTFSDNKLAEEQMKQQELDSMTPWEKYLYKKKEKKKAKKEGTKPKKNNAEKGEENLAFSDDELPDDIDKNDPFFMGAEEPKKSKNKLKKEKKKGKKHEEQEEKNNDLALLVMDSDDDRDHFDYKEIVKNDGKKNKKNRKKKEKKDSESPDKTADSFKIDLKDERFAAVFENPEFNVDPSHPSFKKTKSMKEIIDEKQRRILKGDKLEAQPTKAVKVDGKDGQAMVADESVRKYEHCATKGDDLDKLLKSVKHKSQANTKNKANLKRKRK